MDIQVKNKIRAFTKWMTFVKEKIIVNYGPERELIDHIVHDATISQYLHASTIYLELTLAATDFSEARRQRVIVKRPIQNTKCLKRSRCLLYNEVVFYQNYAHPDDNIPRCYYAHWGQYPGMVIVLQPIEDYGYHSYLQRHPRTYLPFLGSLDGTTLAIREIARFHSKGYIMRETQRDAFNTIIPTFRDNRLMQIRDFRMFFKLLAGKMAEYLPPNIGISIIKKVDNIFCKAPQVFRNMSYPQEPLSTICHGNLKLSNIFFNGSNTDRPVMLANFEFAMYASAVIDLATYINICCPNLEICRFDNILKEYCCELYSCLMHAGIQDVGKYSLNVFSTEYKRCAIGGLIIGCFYLPAIIGQVREDTLNEMDKQDYINCIEKDETNEMGKALTGIIMHLEAVGCLNNYQEFI